MNFEANSSESNSGSEFDSELKKTKAILANPENTLLAVIFSKTGHVICRVTRKKEPLPWQYSVAVMSVVIQIPTLLISIFLDESIQWKELGLLWMGYLELGLFAAVLAHLAALYVYKKMRTYVVQAIERVEDLKDLQSVFARVGSKKNALIFTIGFAIFWCISFSVLMSDYIGGFIGYGLLVGTIIFGFLVGPAIYLEWCYYFFITHLGYYRYTLNESAPGYSQVIYRISRIVTVLIYSIAVFIAFATAAVAFNVGAVILAVLVGWIPTIIYFFASQLSINRIIVNAKWQMLDRIQDEIRRLNNSDITNKENVDAVNRLMDYHERIRVTPNSTLSLGTGINFAGQLALPIIGANIDKIIKLVDSLIK